MIYLKNTKEIQTIYIPRTELYTEQYVNPVKTYEEGFEEGYDSGIVKGIDEQKSKLETIVINDNGTYEREDGYNKVIVEYQDVNGSYDDGYADGKNDGYNEGKEDGFSDGYNEGYDVGYTDGGDNQKSKLESITITENGSYSREDGYSNIEVNVPDLNGSYDEGFEQGQIEGYNKGKNDGIDEQKSKLESISITENGVYVKEDGYNEIVVEVPDLNGSYDDGYSEGYDKGKDDGYSEGVEEGVSNAGEIIAQTAQILDVTENGLYTTKYSKDEDLNSMVTGYFDDGTPFYDYAQLIDKSYKTDVKLNNNSRIELWWKPNLLKFYGTNLYIFSHYDKNDEVDIGIGYNDRPDYVYGEMFFVRFGSVTYNYGKITDKWYHIVVSFDDGFVVDGVKVVDIVKSYNIYEDYGYINYVKKNYVPSNGYFGMIKIDGNTYIPTENGFVNYNTNTPLEVVADGAYLFSDAVKNIGDNLIKTVNVNVQPKVNVNATGIRFGYCDFTEVPEFYDFEGVKYMDYMFSNCSYLKTIPLINTENVTNMYYCFYNCSSLTTIPQLDTSKVTDMDRTFYYCLSLKSLPQLDTSKVTKMQYTFYGCGRLETIPQLDTSKVTNMNRIFYNCTSLKSLGQLDASSISDTSNIVYLFGTSTISTLTDFGGLINLKTSWNDNYGLKMLPNLTYESCINVLNGLYDFTGNNETPKSSQGQLKVHANFLTTVGDEISIGTNKGWTITA